MKQSSLNKISVFLLFCFLLIFPKGGMKLFNVPITWGYLLLGFFSVLTFFNKKIEINHKRLFSFLTILPFIFVCSLSFLINGIVSIEFTISFIVSFIILPFIFYIAFSGSIEALNIEYFSKLLKNSIFIVAIFGIFLFFYKIAFNKFIQIPFLTVNFNDYNLLDIKHIDRGNVYKLISTFNNGNLYGICILMFFPLYLLLEKSFFKKTCMIISLTLTISRTIWIGLLVSLVFYYLLVNRKNYIQFIAFLFISLLSIYFVLSVFEFSNDFVFDKDLGGRFDQLSYLKDISIISHKSFSRIEEMTYLSILDQFGIIGLLNFIIAMTCPFIFIIKKQLNEFHKCIVLGLITYLIIAISDGAILLIPTMAYYWFLSSALLTNKTYALSMDNI